ncbi:hypothetical protein D3C80_719720 [compost metagenome]
MDVGLQVLQPLLVLDAKVLFLVDDEKREVGELNARAEKRMGADDDIDLAVRDILLRLRQFLGRDEAGRLRDPDRQTAEPL